MKALIVMIAIAACSSERALPDGGPQSGVHAPGILDQTSANFHGKVLEREGWQFAVCQRCHGNDFAGGTSGVSCLGCHRGGPTACATCHGANGPTTGAHIVHRAANQSCGECHVVPASWDAPGHLLDAPASVPITFGAKASTPTPDRSGPPSYVDGQCTNVYCHGDALHAAGGTATKPRWDDPTPAGACDRCHGNPPPSHARTDCATCHRDASHIDGIVQVGGACNSCHGDATSPAPPRDLAGNQLTTAVGVGAHRAHLDGHARLRAPLLCSECHRVPAAVGDAGHIDSGPPAEVTLASGGWDHASATCTTSCHGTSAPLWTGGSPEVFCGSCHGIPPASHAPGLTIATCTTCHPQTVDGFGNILLPGLHMNGVVDVE